MRAAALGLLLGLLLALPGGAAPAAAEPYLLAAGDKLLVRVWGHADLSGEVAVTPEGRIGLPLIGAVPAAGLTPEDLAAEIARRLGARYLVNPQVTVEVREYRPFFILGQVNRPGSYPYRPGMTVREAAAVAGGYTRRARHDSVRVTREQGGSRQTLELDGDAPIRPGDVIDVDRRWF